MNLCSKLHKKKSQVVRILSVIENCQELQHEVCRQTFNDARHENQRTLNSVLKNNFAPMLHSVLAWGCMKAVIDEWINFVLNLPIDIDEWMNFCSQLLLYLIVSTSGNNLCIRRLLCSSFSAMNLLENCGKFFSEISWPHKGGFTAASF